MVETLETATTWSNLHALHDAVREALSRALSARGTPPVVMCHVSHLYPSGASLYFTFLARQEAEDPLGQWHAAKAAASDAIVAGGGTITHHHAIGRDHSPLAGGRGGAPGRGPAARRQGAPRSRRGDEPRKAAARLGTMPGQERRPDR